MSPHVWLSTADAIEHSGLGQAIVRNAVASGELPSYRFGRLVKVRPCDLDAWIDSKRSS